MVAVYLATDVLVALGLGAVAVLFITRTLLQKHSSPKKGSTQLRGGGILSLDSWTPLFGDIATLARNGARFHEWVTEQSLAFEGKPWRVHLPGMRNMIIVTDPEQIEEVAVAQFDNFPRGEYQTGVLGDLFGSSLLTWDGDKWHRQRKAATKFFTAKALRTCMANNVQRNLHQVYNVIDKHSAKVEPIDLLKLFHEFALQTFAEIGLGVDMDVIGSKEGHPMEHALEDASPAVMRRFRLPTFYWKLERWLNVGPELVVSTSMAVVREWLNGVVNDSLASATKRQEDRQAGHGTVESDVKSVVELFLEQSSEDKDGLRSEDLVDFILMFVMAARSTSALALVWFFLMLAKHPHVSERLQDELKSVSPDSNAKYLASEDIAHLVYLEATLKEVLRLYPVIPVNQKEAAQDTTIGDDLHVKKGELVCLSYYAMARLPSVWGADAAEFKPERWINQKTGKLIAVSNAKFASFGTGPRICIGMKLAMLELRVVTANLLRRYDFTLAEPNDCSHNVAIELMVATPVMMHASKKDLAV